MQIYVRRGGPNYQKGLAKMRALGQEIGLSIEVFEDHNFMHLHSHVLHILFSLCKVDLPFMDTFLYAHTSCRRQKYTTSARQLAKPNRACNCLPFTFQSSYKCLIQYPSEDFPAHQVVI